MASTHHLIAATRVEGVPVLDASGKRLGRVADLMLDKVSGRATYALMSFDGFLGVGERYYPVPWSMLTYDTARHGYVAPITKAQIEAGTYETPDKLDAAADRLLDELLK